MEERFAIHQKQGLARNTFGLKEDAYTFTSDERLTAARRNHYNAYTPPEERLNGLALVNVLALQPFVDLHRPRQLEVVVRQPILAPGRCQFLQQRRQHPDLKRERPAVEHLNLVGIRKRAWVVVRERLRHNTLTQAITPRKGVLKKVYANYFYPVCCHMHILAAVSGSGTESLTLTMSDRPEGV